MCVLDACRYDIFQEINWLPGHLEKAISAGSTTWEWARNTFTDSYPVVYVSSVPYIAAKIVTEKQKKFTALEHFLAVDDVWWWGYDEEMSTVLPETIAQAALTARRNYPNNTIIAHFIQPHCPYIGNPPLTLKEWEEATGEHSEGFPRVRTIIEKGYYDWLINAYKGNLRKALAAVEYLARQWGDLVVTADHGEGFGENGIYGHDEGIRTPELLEVPWFT